MKTKTINIYSFAELSDKAKETARDNWRQHALDYEWYDYIYDDAQNIGLKITEFDLDRNRHAAGKFILSAFCVAGKIIKEHGEDCETFTTAAAFLKEYNSFMGKAEKDEYGELATYALEGALEEIESEFLSSLLEDYSSILQKECDWHLEDDQIDDSIEAHDCEFLENGKRA